ncbi:MAG TPA: DinB family protein [Bryobacteraceae bacterium]|nr:DinB family protein [Bryobacteraceae bacterium]
MQPEPWLRGPTPDIDPVIAHLLRASQHIREDLDGAVRNLTVAQIWARPEMLNPVGFHAKHLAGSTGRLLTYLQGGVLSARDMAAIPAERAGDEDSGTLIALVNAAFDRYDNVIQTLAPAEFSSLRAVGRARLPVTAISLAIHIAEHGTRHVGQIVSAAALARATVL